MADGRQGLFGGTFNPVHWGHLVIAERVRERFGLEKVLFVPAGSPPHKPGTPLAPAADRLRMVELAVAGNPFFEASPVELARQGPSYTVRTLEALADERPGVSWLLVLGSDAFAEIGTWHRAERLLSLCGIAVVRRPGMTAARALAGVPERFRDAAARMGSAPPREITGRVFPVGGITVGVSSTGIRERAAAGRSIRYLVPDRVMEYITRKNLYREAR